MDPIPRWTPSGRQTYIPGPHRRELENPRRTIQNSELWLVGWLAGWLVVVVIVDILRRGFPAEAITNIVGESLLNC